MSEIKVFVNKTQKFWRPASFFRGTWILAPLSFNFRTYGIKASC